MIIPNDKIKVFISSKCGVEKYDLVRNALKVLIESTQLADVYIFEKPGAATCSSSEQYLYALMESHLCIFLIDNADGISDSVQNEIDVAMKHNIKSLFYFCDESSKEKTMLQEKLTGAVGNRFKEVKQFKDFIDRCSKDVVDELILVFRKYSKPYNTEESNELNLTELGNKDLLNNSIIDGILIKKETMNSNAKTKQYFFKLILGYETQLRLQNEEKSNDLDEVCYKMLPVFLEEKLQI